ncbi:unnamed protein product [Ixodes hexagonus]
MGVMYLTTALALFKYFERYKGFANGLARAGETTAGIVFPPVLVFLQDLYGFRGTLLLCGAISLHATVFCLLLKDPPWMAQKRSQKYIHKPQTLDANLRKSANSLNERRGTSTIVQHSDTQSCARDLLTMFRNPLFYVAITCNLVVHFSQNAFLTTIVDFAMDKGSSLAEASSIISYVSPADFLGRMLLPLLADRNYIRRSTLVMVSFCVTAASVMSLPHTASFATLLPTSVCFVTALGCLLTMEIVIVTDYVGVPLFALCYGLCSLTTIPGILVSPLVFGIFRDSMGTYDNMYRLIGGIHLATTLVFGAVLWSERRTGRPHQTTGL